MRTVDRILERLSSVVSHGNDRWVAKCPAHDDRSPSLAISERSDGAALIHCFSGCTPLEVLAALELELVDLFPPRLEDHGLTPSQRTRHRPSEVFRLLAFESRLLLTACAEILDGTDLNDEDFARMVQAVLTIEHCTEMLS